jgi:hypothetical protein
MIFKINKAIVYSSNEEALSDSALRASGAITDRSLSGGVRVHPNTPPQKRPIHQLLQDNWLY